MSDEAEGPGDIESSPEMARTARCLCGQLTLNCFGNPVRVSLCHCRDCQRRSGSGFAVQARFPVDRVNIVGRTRSWSMMGDSGNRSIFHVCAICAFGGYFINDAAPDLLAVPVGSFADNSFPPPEYSIFETRKPAWLEIVGKTQHFD